MKTKLLTSTIVILLLLGIATAFPVTNVLAGGSSQKVIKFTGWAFPHTFLENDDEVPPAIPDTPVLDPGELIATRGNHELWKGVKIKYHHIWDSSEWVEATFGTGVIINTAYSWNNLKTGLSIMRGTHVLVFDSGITLTGTFFARLYPDASQPSGRVTLARWVSVGDGYKVIWTFDSRKALQDSGIIIKK